MASITLQVIVNDLTNSGLDEYDTTFEQWVRKQPNVPRGGVIEEVIEIDREEDEDDEAA